jgi:hypothetical protein
MIGTSRSGSSLFITYSSTNHRIRSGISEYADSRMIGKVGKPLLDMPSYGFRIHAFLFVFQQNSGDRRVLQQLNRGVAARCDLDGITMRLQSRFAKVKDWGKVVDAQHKG